LARAVSGPGVPMASRCPSTEAGCAHPLSRTRAQGLACTARSAQTRRARMADLCLRGATTMGLICRSSAIRRWPVEPNP